MLSTVSLDCNFPLFWNNTSFVARYLDGGSTVDLNIIERKKLANLELRFPWRDMSVSVGRESRENCFNPDDVAERVIEEEILPSKIIKVASKINLTDTRRTNFSNRSTFNIARSFGDAEYTNFGATNVFNYSLRDVLSRYGGVEKEKYKNLEIENSTNIGFLYEHNPNKPARINDKHHFMTSRGYDMLGDREPALNTSKHPFHSNLGFRHLGSHLGSNFTLQNSTKLFFNAFPMLPQGGTFRSFLHHSTYLHSSKSGSL